MLKFQDYDSIRPSLRFITESWLTENDPLGEYAIEGYQQLESVRHAGRSRFLPIIWGRLSNYCLFKLVGVSDKQSYVRRS